MAPSLQRVAALPRLVVSDCKVEGGIVSLSGEHIIAFDEEAYSIGLGVRCVSDVFAHGIVCFHSRLDIFDSFRSDEKPMNDFRSR